MLKETDKEGNLVAYTDRNGRTIQYTYGIQGLLLKKSGEDGSYHTYKYNENGQLVQSESAGAQYRYEYTPSGRVRTKITKAEELLQKRYTYNGEAYEQVIEQYYLRARYYNPTIARFTQEDVYRGDGLNLYAFCGNNAVMYVDPSGYAGENLERITWNEFQSINQGRYDNASMSTAWYEYKGYNGMEHFMMQIHLK